MFVLPGLFTLRRFSYLDTLASSSCLFYSSLSCFDLYCLLLGLVFIEHVFWIEVD